MKGDMGTGCRGSEPLMHDESAIFEKIYVIGLGQAKDTPPSHLPKEVQLVIEAASGYFVLCTSNRMLSSSVARCRLLEMRPRPPQCSVYQPLVCIHILFVLLRHHAFRAPRTRCRTGTSQQVGLEPGMRLLMWSASWGAGCCFGFLVPRRRDTRTRHA